MKPVSAKELAMLRTEAASVVCDQDCVIKRNTAGTPDGYGTKTESLSTVATTKAGVGQPSASQLQNYAGKIGSQALFQVKLPWGTAAQEDDLLFIGGSQLRVQILLDPGSYDILTGVLAAEIV